MATKQITEFEQVRKYLARVPYLHSGGCGISALAMYRWVLKNEYRPKVRIAMCYDHKSTFNANSKFLANVPNAQPTACTHAGIIYSNYETKTTYILDARGGIDLAMYNYTQIFITRNAWWQ